MNLNFAQRICTIFYFLFLGIIITWTSCRMEYNSGAAQQTSFYSGEKQKGAHIFGSIDSTNLSNFKELGVEWVTTVPWGFMRDETCTEVRHYRSDSTQILEANKRSLERFKRIRNQGFKLFVKPHIWLHEASEGKWRQDIQPKTTEDWKEWETTYADFILRYAKIAELAEAEMFCIGTELSAIARQKPNLFRDLIKQVKEVYSGKLTYAANWYDEYEHIEFWDELDFIGVQAYFPLSETLSPSTEELKAGWIDHLEALKTVHQKFKKSVIFTETGYKSAKDAAIEPWSWAENQRLDSSYFSPETQVNCYQAFFDTVWVQPWFKGLHLWQMRTDHHQRDSAYYSLDFTPQGKPALDVIKHGFRD